MALLSHEIPWQSLVSVLEYVPSRTGSGPQYARIDYKKNTKQEKQLEYFASTLQHAIQEHGLTERRKHRDASAYKNRAASWIVSVSESPTVSAGNHAASLVPQGVTSTSSEQDAQRIEKNRRLREMQDSSYEDWASKTENRMVYTDIFIDEYAGSELGETSGVHQQNMSFLHRRYGMKVQDWLDPDESPDATGTYYGMPSRSITLNNILKLLVIDAALALQQDRRHRSLENVFLLIHHPRLDLAAFRRLYLPCCPIGCEFDRVAHFALKLFLLLNMVVTMVDQGAAELIRLEDTATGFMSGGRRKLTHYDTIWHSNPAPATRYVELLPRPAYMNLRTWRLLMEELCDRHPHMSETVLSFHLLYPAMGEDSMRVEIDPLADRPTLKRMFKQLWICLVIMDMLTREMSRPINWENLILESLADLIGWPGPESFCEYEVRRDEYIERAEGRPRISQSFSRYDMTATGWL